MDSSITGATLARRLVQEVLDEGRDCVCDEILADGFTFSGSDTASSREEFKGALTRMREKFPEMRFTLRTVIEQGQDVCAVVAIDAVHGGAFLGIEPTGRPFQVEAVYLLRFEDDRIAAAAVIMNVLDVLVQIGAWPPSRAPR